MITINQVTALTAQTAFAVYNMFPPYDADGNLKPDWILNSANEPMYNGIDIGTNGIGRYAQSPADLTLAGFLKPGTIDTYLQDPADTYSVLNMPEVWTQQLGVAVLSDYLDSTIIQNIVQQALMQGAYEGLINAGVIDGEEPARFQAALIQPATQYGVTAVLEWIAGTASPDLLTKIKIAARQGQYAIDFVEAYANSLNISPELNGFTDTMDRTALDVIVANIIGNQKIPTINYTGNTQPILVDIPAVLGDGTFRFAPDNPLRK